MKLFLSFLALSFVLCLAIPLPVMSEPFTAPTIRNGIADRRIAPYPPKLGEKPMARKPFRWKPDHPHRHHNHLLYVPYGICCQNSSEQQDRVSPPPQPVPTESIVLNPDIFDPKPKTPLTLVIDDGVIVETYRGY